MKTAFIYVSTRHGSTKKLVDAITGKDPVAVFDAQTVPAAHRRDFVFVHRGQSGCRRHGDLRLQSHGG